MWEEAEGEGEQEKEEDKKGKEQAGSKQYGLVCKGINIHLKVCECLA